MAKKKLVLKSSFLSFLSADLRTALLEDKEIPENLQGELDKAREFFAVEDLKQTGEFYIHVENVLWSLFERLQAPESPLRMKAHERMLQEVATTLSASLDSENLPVVDPKLLKSVVSMVEEPEQFKSLELPFEYKNGDTKRILKLPAINILSDDEFVTALDEIFTPAKE